MGTKLLFSTTYHPQTDGQTECLSFIEFAYNRVVHSATSFSPFEVVYGFNPLTHLNLLPLTVNERGSLDGKRKAKLVKSLHEKVKAQIEEKSKLIATKVKQRKKVYDI